MSRYFSSVATLCRESHQVWRILTSIETFIQCGDFYPVLRYLLSIGTFVKYWDFYQAQRLISSVDTYIKNQKFYPVQRRLSSLEAFIEGVEDFIQYRGFYAVQRLSSRRQTFIYNPGKNIWNKLEKSSKAGQDKKCLISTFACFLTSIAKVLFLEGRLGTRLCLHPNLKFF